MLDDCIIATLQLGNKIEYEICILNNLHFILTLLAVGKKGFQNQQKETEIHFRGSVGCDNGIRF